MEMIRDPKSRAPDKERTARVIGLALQVRLMLLAAGQYGNVLRAVMPLHITDDQLDEGSPSSPKPSTSPHRSKLSRTYAKTGSATLKT